MSVPDIIEDEVSALSVRSLIVSFPADHRRRLVAVGRRRPNCRAR